MLRFRRLQTAIILFFVATPLSAFAQIYRPPLKWYQLHTLHFHVIYYQGEEASAKAAASILEDQYNNAKSLTGGSLHNFPVILNGYNDLANGFVSPYLFRMEVEIPEMKGKMMNPRTGGWFENVFPHELVHAMQFSVLPWPGISGFVRLFSPDAARSLQGNIVAGFDEGLAVYNESNVRPGVGGRGNYSMFTNYFGANLDGNHTWSMGQLLQISGQTRPYDRHYMGGYQYVHWLESHFGKKKVRDIIAFDSRWPFMGLGGSIWAETGTWPGKLYHRFETDKKKQEHQRIDSLKAVGIRQNSPLPIHYNGSYIRRPLWLNNHTLIFHASFYNAPSGFYTYNLKNNKLRRIAITNSVSDYQYDLNQDRNKLLFANYRGSGIYYNDYKTDLYELNLSTGHTTRLTTNKRVFSPVFKGSSIWALQTDQQSARWVYITGHGKTNSLLDVKPNTLVAIAPNPVDTSLTAVVANRNGVQGIWFISLGDRNYIEQYPPDIAFHDASIFDPSWSPDGTKLLFSCDRGGTMNVYSYNRKTKKIWQLTNSHYNAFEGSFSPDGSKIAYIRQLGEDRVPVVIKTDSLNRIAVGHNQDQKKIDQRLNSERLADHWKPKGDQWHTRRYHSGISWIKPRIIAPYLSDNSVLGYRLGAYLSSQDFLQRNYYLTEFSTSNGQLWYNAEYYYTGFYPGFILKAYHEPSNNVYLSSPGVNGFLYTFETQGYSLGIPLPIVLERNVRYSSLSFKPEIDYERLRPITANSAVGPWKNATAIDLNETLNWRLQQNIRDAQPNSGSILFSETKFDIHSTFPDLRSAFRAGLYQYLSPLSRFNQSLRLGLIYQTQSKIAVFSNSTLVSDGFRGYPLISVNNALSFQTRYTIPIITPDNGGLLIPVYMQQIYGTLFTDTITDLDQNNLLKASRTIYGIGIHFVTGLSNLRIDIGFGLAYEVTRNNLKGFAGTF